jgi:mRNA interferase HicA
MKRKEFEKFLRQNNCLKIREGSNHSVWQNQINYKQSSVPRHVEILKTTCRVICKQLEIKSPV